MTEVLHNHVILELLVILLFPRSKKFLLLSHLRTFFSISYIFSECQNKNKEYQQKKKKLDIELNIFVFR